MSKPGRVATQADDFTGIWAIDNGLISRNLDTASRRPPPPYNPEWLAAWNTMRAKAARGERVIDADKECWPVGMPNFNNWDYPGEILMTRGQVTLLAEYQNQTRRIFTDGRPHPPAEDLEPTLRGHSIGHWEGKTLVVDTIGIRGDTQLGIAAYHSDKIHVIERMRLLGPDKLEWVTTIEDPVALAHPMVITRTLVRQSPDTEIREYVCEENHTREAYAPSAVDLVWPK